MAVFQNAGGAANNNFNASTSGQTNEFFVPEIFSKKIQNFFRKSSVIEAITNTDYAGEIAAFGDTVKIIKEPEITVAAYTRAASTTKQYLTDQELTLVIDKANSFKFIVDDIEEKLSHINFASVGASSADYTLNNTMDSEVLTAMFAGVSTSGPDHQLGGDTANAASGSLALLTQSTWDMHLEKQLLWLSWQEWQDYLTILKCQKTKDGLLQNQSSMKN